MLAMLVFVIPRKFNHNFLNVMKRAGIFLQNAPALTGKRARLERKRRGALPVKPGMFSNMPADLFCCVRFLFFVTGVVLNFS